MQPRVSNQDIAAFVESVDSLFGHNISPGGDDGFSVRPPLVMGAKNEKHSLKLLKKTCRSGLPPQLRCAVWISSVARIANPHLPISETDSYGTVGHEKKIEAKWNYALKAAFPNSSDRDDVIAPDLGLGQQALHQLIRHDFEEWNMPTPDQKSISELNVRSLTGILCAVHQVLGIEYCPPLPDITAILLTHMRESYVFATIREMIDDTSHFLPVSQKEYYSWCKTYSFFVEKMFPATHKVMEKCGALDPQSGLDPIFKRFFSTILKREDLLRFMDVFVIEGCKAIFRLALSLLMLIPKKDLKSLLLTDSKSWWNEIRYRTLDRAFSFQKHLQIMFPKFETISMRYPRRRLLSRMNRFHEHWALENMPTYVDQTPPKPIGFTSDGCILAKPASVRSNLARWLPPSLKSTKLDLIYSTEKHGRSLTSFYKECQRAKNTVILVEAIIGDHSSTIGMFASYAWSKNCHSLGDGECFMFRMNPDPQCFYWFPKAPDVSGTIDDMEHQTLREQVMIARSDYIAMGSNREGTNGLRLDRDLIKGESYSAAGFDNDLLPGQLQKTFEIGFVEVYQLIRDFGGEEIGRDDSSLGI